MTWRWHIVSNIAAAWVLAIAEPALAATVSGRVELRDSRDAAVVKTHNFSGVVVWLKPVAPASIPPGQARIVQTGKRFDPHIQVVAVGTKVDFPNMDPIFHSAFSNFDGQLFDIGLYPPGASRSVKFDRAGFVRVFCNIHPMMSAVIVVVDTPYFATSGKDGAFRMPNVPPGEYQLLVFHERATQETLEKLGRHISITGADVSIPQLAISESGYLIVPHKNKFGREYPPDEGPTYPGAKK